MDAPGWLSYISEVVGLAVVGLAMVVMVGVQLQKPVITGKCIYLAFCFWRPSARPAAAVTAVGQPNNANRCESEIKI